jgi:hypothetical protein
MSEKTSLDRQAELAVTASVMTEKSKSDLVVLLSMAKKLAVTLHTLEQTLEPSLPVRYSFNERRGREHRVIVCAPEQLLSGDDLYFVGFVSQRRQDVTPQIIDELFRIDQQMLSELTAIPGLLSYSSLELRRGNWYNLVIFRETSPKAHFQSMEVHRYAAYQLSPAYYRWVRLHSGRLAGGLARQHMLLRHTKYYFFSGTQQVPVTRELTYNRL